MTSATRIVSLALALLLLVSGIAPVGGSVLADTGTTERNVAGTSVSLQSNNTTSSHDDPDIRREDRELDGMQRWLSNRMGEVLVDCTEGAVADQSGVCELNTTYPSHLERYADLAGESNAESDDEAVERFEEADDHQREFNEDAKEYHETKEEFEEARENNNTQRQRELARELLRHARAVNESGGVLLRDYRWLMQQQNLDLEDGVRTVNRTREDAQTTAQELRELYFVSTNITAQELSETASFTDPMPIRGRVAVTNGTAIGNSTIHLVVGGRPVTAETNETGWFRTQYRPRFALLNTSRVTVHYIPRNESQYLRSSTQLPVTIRQVTPTIHFAVSPSTAGFGDRIRFQSNVTINGTVVGRVPLNISVGDRHPVSRRTNRNGEFDQRVQVPAVFDDGQRRVRASVALKNRAIGRADATTHLNITTTATTLSVDARTVEAREVVVTGELSTVNAPTPANRRIEVLVGDEVVATTRTNSSGMYQTSFVVPADAVSQTSNTSVAILARFSEEPTNLEPASTETSTTVSPRELETPASAEETPLIPEWLTSPIVLVILGELLVLGIMLVTGGILWRRRHDEITPGSTAGLEDSSQEIGADVKEADMETAEPPTLLELAREQIEAGVPARGIEAGYLAVRRDLESRLDGGAPQTHWEFFARCAESELDDEELSALQELTQAYERAIFSPGGISRSDADTALSKAGSLFESLRQPT